MQASLSGVGLTVGFAVSVGFLVAVGLGGGDGESVGVAVSLGALVLVVVIGVSGLIPSAGSAAQADTSRKTIITNKDMDKLRFNL